MTTLKTDLEAFRSSASRPSTDGKGEPDPRAEAAEAWKVTPPPPEPPKPELVNTCPVHGPGPCPDGAYILAGGETVFVGENDTRHPLIQDFDEILGAGAYTGKRMADFGPDRAKAAINVTLFTLMLTSKTNAFREYVKKNGGPQAWGAFKDGEEAFKFMCSLVLSGKI